MFKNVCLSYLGPCFNNGDCTHFAACIDWSTEAAPNHTCVCTMAKSMVGGRCIGNAAHPLYTFMDL